MSDLEMGVDEVCMQDTERMGDIRRCFASLRVVEEQDKRMDALARRASLAWQG